MIWYYLILFVTSVLTAVFSFLPKVEELPFGADAFLVSMVGYYNSAAEIIPWLSIIMSAFLFYLGFRVSLVILSLLKIYRHHTV